MHGMFYIIAQVFCLVFGVLVIAHGVKELFHSRAESYDADSLKLNLWGAIGAIAVGFLLMMFGLGWWPRIRL